MNQHITHIGIIVNDLDAAVRYWVDTLDFREIDRITIDEEGVRTVMLSASGSQRDIGVELIEPIDKHDMSNPLARHLAQKGEGFFHLAMAVADLPKTEASLKAQGATVFERPPAPLGTPLADIIDASASRLVAHPRCSNGVLIEFLQRSDPSDRA